MDSYLHSSTSFFPSLKPFFVPSLVHFLILPFFPFIFSFFLSILHPFLGFICSYFYSLLFPLILFNPFFVSSFLRFCLSAQFAVFLGVPFAAPPVGERRWKPPSAPQPWTDVRRTDALPPICPQFTMKDLDIVLGQEDCLYLNIWAPRDFQNKKLPIMFWIYGGGYVMGDGYEFGRFGFCPFFFLPWMQRMEEWRNGRKKDFLPILSLVHPFVPVSLIYFSILLHHYFSFSSIQSSVHPLMYSFIHLFIHPLIHGSIHSGLYDATDLMKHHKGQFIFVSFNYRVGPFG